jgi:hypothetical protein
MKCRRCACSRPRSRPRISRGRLTPSRCSQQESNGRSVAHTRRSLHGCSSCLAPATAAPGAWSRRYADTMPLFDAVGDVPLGRPSAPSRHLPESAAPALWTRLETATSVSRSSPCPSRRPALETALLMSLVRAPAGLLSALGCCFHTAHDARWCAAWCAKVGSGGSASRTIQTAGGKEPPALPLANRQAHQPTAVGPTRAGRRGRSARGAGQFPFQSHGAPSQ